MNYPSYNDCVLLLKDFIPTILLTTKWNCQMSLIKTNGQFLRDYIFGVLKEEIPNNNEGF